MRKIVLASTALCAVMLFSSVRPRQETAAYICDNKKTEVYHKNSRCASLNRCTHTIVKTTVGDARNKGLRLCGNEY